MHLDWGAAALFTVWEVYHADASQLRAPEGKGDELWENQGRGTKPSFGRRRVADFSPPWSSSEDLVKPSTFS